MTHQRRAVAVATALALVACRGGSDPAPAPTPTPTDTATASIIRPEVVASPVVDLPPAPLAATIGFPEGGAALDEAARAAIDKVLASEQLGEGWPVVLRGHSDSAGRDIDNLTVSRRRAEAVADYLAGHGVARQRISVIALGEQNSVAPNAHPDGTPDEEGRAKNRRVEIAIAPPVEPPPAEPAAAEDALDGEAEP